MKKKQSARPVKKAKITRKRVEKDDALPYVDWSPKDPSGYNEKWAARDTNDALAMMAGSREFPEHLRIDEKDWKDCASDNDKYGTWPVNYSSRYTNQSPTHECTCHSLIQNFEIAWNRQQASKNNPVWMSPLSVYAEANPRIRGGSYVMKVLEIAIARGILPENNGPKGNGTQKDKFEHTLYQTAGNNGGKWVAVSNFPSGWRDTAKHFRPLEIFNITTWREHVMAILQGYCVSNGRAGHAIPHVKIEWKGGKLHSMYRDSYDVDRYDSVNYIKKGVGGAFCIATTTIPDDWNNPTMNGL